MRLIQAALIFPVLAAALLGIVTVLPSEAAVTCFATHNDGTTVFSSNDLQAVRDAAAAAGINDVVKIAGTCTGFSTPPLFGVSINKQITLRGGYTTADWTAYDPIMNPTILDGNNFWHRDRH